MTAEPQSTPEEPPPSPTFWSRQLRGRPTRRQWVFDAVFGVVAPVLCVLLDPIVFDGGEIGGVEIPYLLVFLWLEVGLLFLWLLLVPWVPLGGPVAGLACGGLAVGAAFAVALGVTMLPLTLLGLVVGIGLLGLTPFVTAWVFFRNAARARGPRRSARPRPVFVSLAFAGALAVTAAAWAGGMVWVVTWRGLQTNRWWSRVSQSAPMDPCGGADVVGFRGRLWVLGARVLSSLDGTTWEEEPTRGLPACWDLGVTAFQERLWILGGGETAGHSPHHGVWSSEDGRAWTRVVTEAPWAPRKDPVVLVFERKLWLLGGLKLNAGNEPHRDVWCSDDGATWKEIIPEAPWKCLAAEFASTVGDMIWVAERDPYHSQHAWRLWSSRDGSVWSRLYERPPWCPRREFGCVEYAGAVWILGGEQQLTRDTYVEYEDVWLSTNGRDWTEVTRRAPWGAWYGPQAVAEEDRLWLLGGSRVSSGEVWAFEVPRESRSWLGLAPAPD